MKSCPRLLAVFCLLLPVASYAQQSVVDSLRALLQAHPQKDNRRAELLNAMAFQLHTSQPEKSIAYADEVIGFLGHDNDNPQLAAAYSQRAIAYVTMSKFDEAQLWTEKALEIERKINRTEGIASNIGNLGLIQYRKTNYPRALAYLQEAAEIFRSIKHPNEIPMYLNMTSIYAETKNLKKAEEYGLRALAASRQSGNKSVEAYSLLNLGAIYIDLTDHDKGRKYLDSAMVVNRQINNQANVAKVYSNLAASYNRTNEYETSNVYYRQALAINEALHNLRSIAVIDVGMGENYLKLDSLRNAYRHLSDGLRAAQQLDAIDVLRDASKNLSSYFEQTGGMDSALFYHKQFTSLKDSLESESNQKEITRLELQHDFDLKEQDYIQQRALSKLQIRQLWLYGIIAIVLLVAAAGYLLNRSRVRALRLRNEMREKDLTQKAEALLMRQQVSESELKAIRSQMNPHFIFNVLNSIESYILENDAKAASKLVQRFARLTRLILENSTQTLVTADRELEAVRLYAELEATRFDHSFDYRFNIDPALDLRSLMLPPMLIQPLVENAILHGLRHVKGYRGLLNVTVSQADDHLMVEVEDNGIGLTAAKTKERTPTTYKEKSLGLAGINDRLAVLNIQYPMSRADLKTTEIDTPGKTGTCIRLCLPLIPTTESTSTH